MRKAAGMGSNRQIDNTDYYRLPCGKFLEDFIFAAGLNFAEGSALKYAYRAGQKQGEDAATAWAKAAHYVRFLADKGCVDAESVMEEVKRWYQLAWTWDGKAAVCR
jgi:hypothetical protein